MGWAIIKGKRKTKERKEKETKNGKKLQSRKEKKLEGSAIIFYLYVKSSLSN
jgi:hypothetical protein